MKIKNQHILLMVFVFLIGLSVISVIKADNSETISKNFVGAEITDEYYYTQGLKYENSSVENAYRNFYKTGQFNHYLTEKQFVIKEVNNIYQSKSSIAQFYFDDSINDVLDIDYDNAPYNATYSFENEIVGTQDTAIDFIDSKTGTVGYTKIENSGISEFNNNILFYDGTTSGGTDYTNSLDTPIIEGSIEFWIMIENTLGGDLWIQFREGSSYGIWLICNLNLGQAEYTVYTSGASAHTEYKPLNQWAHFRFEINCTSHSSSLFIDNSSIYENLGFYNTNINQIDTMWFTTGYTGTGKVYMDAIDFSYDIAYYTNRNQYTYDIPNDNYDLVFGIDMYLDWISGYTSAFQIYLTEGIIYYHSGIVRYAYYNYTLESLEFEIQTYERYDEHDSFYKVGTRCLIYANNELIANFTQNVASMDTNPLLTHLNNMFIKNLDSDNINSLKGYRLCYYNQNNDVGFPFDFPKFYDDFAFVLQTIDESKYWTYLSVKLDTDYIETITFSQEITIGSSTETLSFSYEFNHVKPSYYTAKFCYNDVWIKKPFFWLIDWIRILINAFMTMLQFLFFILVAGINILFGSLFIALIIPFIWNILIYYIVYAFVYIIFYLYIGLVYIFGWLLYLLNPLFEFIFMVVIPFLVDIFVKIFSWVIAIFLYLITLGQSNLFEIQQIIQTFLENLANGLLESLYYVGRYLPEFLGFFIFYLLNMGLLFIKFDH